MLEDGREIFLVLLVSDDDNLIATELNGRLLEQSSLSFGVSHTLVIFSTEKHGK